MANHATEYRPPKDGETWHEWAAEITGQTGDLNRCDHCGGTGEIATIPSVPVILAAITGLDSPTLTPKRCMSRLDNPDLETLRRVAALIRSDLDAAAHFIEDLVAAFKSHPARTGRKSA